MAKSKLDKIIINRFAGFNNEEIKFNDSTLINAKYLTTDAIKPLLTAFQFLLTNSSFDIETVYFQGKLISDSTTFVEAHVVTPNQEFQILRKSIAEQDLVYSINSKQVTNDDFRNKIIELELNLAYTHFVLPRTIASIASMSEQNRTSLIENLCDNSTLEKAYNEYEIKLHDYALEMKCLDDQLKELNADKKIEKLKIENSTKMKEAKVELDQQHEQFSLFNIYHMNKEFEEEKNNPQHFDRQCFDNYKENLINLNEMAIHKRENQKELLKPSMKNEHISEVILNERYKDELAILNHSDEHVNRVQTKINGIKQNLEELDQFFNKYIARCNQYSQVQKEMILSKPKYVKLLLLQQIMRLPDFQAYHAEKSNKFVERKKFLNEKMSLCTKDYELCERKIERVKTKIASEKHELEKNSKIIKMHERMLLNEEIKAEFDAMKKFEQKLRQKYPSAIIGILSELFETENPIAKHCILEMLGKFANGIVVTNTKAANNCARYLYMHGYDNLDVTFISLCDYKEIIIQNKQSLTFIDEYILPANNDIRIVLMNLLGSVVVCDTKVLAKHIFESLVGQITVVSFNDRIAYKRNGIIEIFSDKLDSENLDVEKIIDNLKKFKDIQIKRKKLIAILEYQLGEFESKRETFQYQRHLMKAQLEQYAEMIQVAKEKFDNISGFDQNVEMTQRITSTYNNLMTELGNEFETHLKEISLSIENFESVAEIAGDKNTYEQNRQVLSGAKEIYENLMEKLTTKSKLEQRIDNTRTKLNESDLKIYQQDVKILAENDKIYSTCKDKTADYSRAKETCVESREQIINFFDQYSEAKYHLRLPNEIFLLINQVFLNFETIPMKERLIDILRYPMIDDLDENPLDEQLAALEIDTSKLSEELKTTVNVSEKMQELEIEIKSRIDAFAGFPLCIEGDLNAFEGISKRIKNIEKEKKKIFDKRREFKANLEDVKRDRAEKFSECLTVINKEVANFCRIALNGEIRALLTPINDQEPYLNGIQYFWQTNQRETYIHEIDNNNIAALAVFLGILKYKKQKLIIFADTLLDVAIRDSLVKYSKSDEADFQTIIMTKIANDDNCHYFISHSDEFGNYVIDENDEVADI